MAHRVTASLSFLSIAFALLLLTVLPRQLATAAEAKSELGSGLIVLHLPDGSTFERPIPPEAFSKPASGFQAPVEIGAPPSPESKLHPLLAEELRSSPPDQTEELIINFRDQVKIPRFPKPLVTEGEDSPVNQEALAEAARLVEQIRATRRPLYAARVQELSALGVKVLETFWLIDAMRVRMPLSLVEGLARRSDILYIGPSQTPIPPPDTDPNNDVLDARTYIRTDSLADIASGGFVGLLDTGVRSTHVLLSNPSPLRYVRDCVNGTSNNCASGTGLNPDDDCWNHGTSTAAIITGNSNLGNDYRGVDWVTLDSYKVYPTGCVGLNEGAVLRGFQAAVALLDQVIVAEMQGSGSDSSPISTAADAAYDAGAIVVAANGNFGPSSGTVNTPANAHKVIGVGAFDLETLAQYSGQSRGPAPDGRIKPDIQTPTNSETASTASSTALQVFSGTSGATPYGAGLAIGLRNWIGLTGGASFLPGIGYAWMILMGQNVHPFDNTSGAGPARFVPNGILWQAKAVFSSGPGVTDIALDSPWGLEAYPYNLNAAIWWPETVTDTHNDVDLFIVDPSGVVRASSTSTTSVFERAQVPGLLAPGIWKVRVQNKGSRSQDVFVGAYRTSS